MSLPYFCVKLFVIIVMMFNFYSEICQYPSLYFCIDSSPLLFPQTLLQKSPIMIAFERLSSCTFPENVVKINLPLIPAIFHLCTTSSNYA